MPTIPLHTENIDEILSIQEIHRYNESSTGSEGFVVHPATRADIERLLCTENGIALTKSACKSIAAYCLAYRLSVWQEMFPQWKTCVRAHDTDFLSQHATSDTLYLRHIVRAPNGEPILVAELGKEIIATAKDNGYRRIIGEILHTPVRNDVSFRFHHRLGYQEKGIVKYPEDPDPRMEWSLLSMDL